MLIQAANKTTNNAQWQAEYFARRTTSQDLLNKQTVKGSDFCPFSDFFRPGSPPSQKPEVKTGFSSPLFFVLLVRQVFGFVAVFPQA
jgi:hypothetical protein